MEESKDTINTSANASRVDNSQDASAELFGSAAQQEEEKVEEVALNPAQALALRKKRTNVVQNDKTIPHLTNLNEDPQMSGIVYISAAKGEILVGRKTGTPQPDIILGSIGIKPNHAKIKILQNGLFQLSVIAEAAVSTFVNG